MQILGFLPTHLLLEIESEFCELHSRLQAKNVYFGDYKDVYKFHDLVIAVLSGR